MLIMVKILLALGSVSKISLCRWFPDFWIDKVYTRFRKGMPDSSLPLEILSLECLGRDSAQTQRSLKMKSGETEFIPVNNNL